MHVSSHPARPLTFVKRRPFFSSEAIPSQLFFICAFNRILSFTRSLIVGQFEITDLAGRPPEELAGLLE